MREIDTAEVLAAVREVISERPEGWGYAQEHMRALGSEWVPGKGVICQNWSEPHGTRIPLCIAGQVYDKLGLLNLTDAIDGVDGTVLRFRRFEVKFSGEAAQLLRWMQTRQDRGESWREACEGAVSKM